MSIPDVSSLYNSSISRAGTQTHLLYHQVTSDTVPAQGTCQRESGVESASSHLNPTEMLASHLSLPSTLTEENLQLLLIKVQFESAVQGLKSVPDTLHWAKDDKCGDGQVYIPATPSGGFDHAAGSPRQEFQRSVCKSRADLWGLPSNQRSQTHAWLSMELK